MSNNNKKRNIAIGAGAGLALGAGVVLARRPGLRAHLGAKWKSMFSSGEEKALAKLNISGKIPEASVRHARRMIRDLKRQGYSLNQIRKMRIGVVGSTGSGKSSLARAIEQELGHTRMSLDEFVSYVPFRSGNVNVDQAIASKGGVKPGTVVEQSQLLHSGDPSHFDVIMKIERPAEDIKRGLLQRGHAAVTADYVDLTKAQRTVNEAFGTIAGKRRRLGSGLEMVVNPGNERKASKLRLARARELGLNMSDFSALSKRDQIQSLANNSVTGGHSFRQHISSGKLGKDITTASALALGGGATGALMSKESSRSRIDTIMAQIDQHNMPKYAFAGMAAKAMAPATGALVGGTAGALAGGEGNRLGGALSGALIGAGGGLAINALGRGAGRAVNYAPKGSKLEAQYVLQDSLGIFRRGGTGEIRLAKGQNLDDVLIGQNGKPVTVDMFVKGRGPVKRPVTKAEFTKLKRTAASDTQAGRWAKDDLKDMGFLKSDGNINEAFKVHTFSDLSRHQQAIVAAGDDVGKLTKAYDDAVASGIMSEKQVAEGLRYSNPERYNQFIQAQAAQREAAKALTQQTAQPTVVARPPQQTVDYARHHERVMQSPLNPQSGQTAQQTVVAPQPQQTVVAPQPQQTVDYARHHSQVMQSRHNPQSGVTPFAQSGLEPLPPPIPQTTRATPLQQPTKVGLLPQQQISQQARTGGMTPTRQQIPRSSQVQKTPGVSIAGGELASRLGGQRRITAPSINLPQGF